MTLPKWVNKKLLIVVAAAIVVGALLFVVWRKSGKVRGAVRRKTGMGGSYFTIDELCKNDKPTEAVKEQLQLLIDNVLDPMREEYGKPVRVTSGYRSPEYNKRIGGATNSQHTKGQAADLQTGEGKEGNKRIFDIIKKQGHFDQLIDEKNYQWIHVSYNPQRQRHEILRYDGSKYHKIQ